MTSVQIPRGLVVFVPLDKQRADTEEDCARSPCLQNSSREVKMPSLTLPLVFYHSTIPTFFTKYFLGRNIQATSTVDLFTHLTEYVPCIYTVKKLEIDSMRFSAVDVSERPQTCTLVCRPRLKVDLFADRPSCWLGDSVVTASAPAERNVLAVKTGSRICLEPPRYC